MSTDEGRDGSQLLPDTLTSKAPSLKTSAKRAERERRKELRSQTRARRSNAVALARRFPILEPLSVATQSVIEPLALSENDYLVLDLDKDGRRFLAEVKPHRVVKGKPYLEWLKTHRIEDSISGDWRRRLREFREEKHLPGDPRAYDGTPLKARLYGFTSENARARFFTRIPEHRWLGKPVRMADGSVRHAKPENFHKYLLAATDYTALVVHHSWPESRIVFACDEARMTHEFLLRRFFAQNLRAAVQAKYKLEGVAPTMPEDYVRHPDFPLSQYQEVALLMSAGQEGLALFMEQGTGKTAVIVNRVCLEARRTASGRIKRPDGSKRKSAMTLTLIIVPPSLRLNWQLEFTKFATAPGKVVVLRGAQHQRAKLVMEAIKSDGEAMWSAVVVSYDTMVQDVEVFKRVPWDLIVCDESQWFKSKETQRWKALLELRDSGTRRTALTGTPIGNHAMDLWTQLELLGEGQSGFMSFSEFRRCHGVIESVEGASGNAVEKLVGLKNIPLLQERLARMAFSITKKEAGLQLPDKVYDVVEIEMTPRQAEIYRSVASQLIVEIEGILSEGKKSGGGQIKADHILTKLLRLAQITSGFVTYSPTWDESGTQLTAKRTEQIDAANPKIEAVVADLTDPDRDPKSKAVIWACWVEDIQELGRRLTKAGVEHALFYGATPQEERELIAKRFNGDDSLRVIVANPQVAGLGLNFLGYDPTNPGGSECYCDFMGFMSQGWSMLLRAQAEDRSHRRGTRMPLRIRDYVSPGTIDEDIRSAVTDKKRRADLIQDVADTLRSVLGMNLSAESLRRAISGGER